MAAPNLKVVKQTDKALQSIYDELRKSSLDGLNDLNRVLLENVDDALFELADKVETNQEHTLYFEAMREIRLKAASIKQKFEDEMSDQFEIFSGAKLDIEEITQGEPEMALIELDELEDSIAIQNMISKARPLFELELFALNQRIMTVLNREEVHESDCPIDPKAICFAFHKAAGLLETDIKIKLIFYKLFDRYVMTNLGHFYQELNQILIDKDVLADFDAETEQLKQTTRFLANRIKAREPQALAAEKSILETSLNNGNAGTFADTPSFDPSNLFSALQQVVQNGFLQPNAAHPTATMAGAVNLGALTPISDSAISNFSISDGDNSGPQMGPEQRSETGLNSNPPNQIFVAALTGLQTNSIPEKSLTSVDPQYLRMATQQRLTAFKSDATTRVSATDSQTIDVVSMLFDFFFDDEALPTPVKVLIGRLQIPILKVAILDKNFFNHKQHPARQLLDSISRAALGWSEDQAEQKELLFKIEEIVGFLLNEFDDDVAAFEFALAELQLFLKEEDGKLDEIKEKLIDQERQRDLRIKNARDATKDLISKLTKNRELGSDVTNFLNGAWYSVLYRTHISQGGSSKHWKKLRRISSTLIWTLVPKHTEEERIRIIKTIPALLRALSKGMQLAKIKNQEQNIIFRMLAQEHASIVKQTSKNTVTRVDDVTVWPTGNLDEMFNNEIESESNQLANIDFIADDTIASITTLPTESVIDDLNQFSADVKHGNIFIDEEIVLESAGSEDVKPQTEQNNDDFDQLAATIKIGDWIEFKEPEKSLIARLSWKSNVTGNLVFVNRQGHKIKNMTIKNLADQMRAGEVKGVESSSAFDRAISNIMAKIEQKPDAAT